MEDDDEFGDLYTDVLRPLTTSFTPRPHHLMQPTAATTPPPLQRSIDLNIRTDAEGTPIAAPDSNRISLVLLDGLDSKAEFSDNSRAAAYGDPNLLDESGINVAVEATDPRGDVLLETNVGGAGRSQNVDTPMDGNGNFGGDEADTGIRDLRLETTIPSLSHMGGSVTEDDKLMGGSQNTGNLKEQNAAFDNLESAIPGISDGRNRDDSDSDSEDGLQIVLNDDNKDRNVLMDRNRMIIGGNYDEDDDEDEEPLVIVADDDDLNKQQLMEQQEWGGEAADGERKELDDASKASGGASVTPKIGYHPYHSQFKYVRPGAAPIPATTPIASGGVPGQVRPLFNMGPIGGRGRGDWRSAGMKNAPPLQKGFHPGYGMTVWGSNATRHGFGGGLEFTLPSHKTVFEVDIDGFVEKPWRLPGIDISDYFNFGLNEESWKEYCKRLEQIRLEATMQSKIRVHESGRTEQDYDPDMPPELAAVAGIHDVPLDSATLTKTDAGQTDVSKGPRLRPAPPTGRAIQVESGYGERLPSIDTRPPRSRDSDAIIEIVLQESFEDDSYQENNITERPENGLLGEGFRGNEIDKDVQQEEIEHSDGFSHAYDDGRRGIGRTAQVMKTLCDNMVDGDEISPLPLESRHHHCPDSREHMPESPRRNFGIPQEQRGPKEKRTRDRSPSVTPNENILDKQFLDDWKEESVEAINGKYSPLLSSPVTSKGAGRKVEHNDLTQDVLLLEDGNSEMEKDEMTLNTSTTNDGFKGEKLSLSSKKQKLSSQVEQPYSQEAARSSENSKARSESSRDFQKSRDAIEVEVVQDGLSTSLRNVKRPVSIDENSALQRSYHEKQKIKRHRMTLKGRDDAYYRKEVDHNSAHHLHMKSDFSDRRKESDNTDRAWQLRNKDSLGRRPRAEETRKRESSVEVGSRCHNKVRETERSDRDENHQSRKLDNSAWRARHDKDERSQHRDRDDSFRGLNEGMDYVHGKRRKDDSQVRRDHFENEESMHLYRESSSLRKRERDEILDQRRKDDQARLRDDDQHVIRQRKEAMFGRDKVERQREREEWHRFKQSHEDILSKREREEGRGSRSGRAVEEKALISHSRMKDDSRSSDKRYYLKDTGNHPDQVKQREQIENEHRSQQRGHEDVYPHGNRLSNDEKASRHDRGSAHYDRVVNSSDRVYENKHKDRKRKGKESEDGENSSTSSKRKQEGHICQKSEMGSLKGEIKQTSGVHEIPVNRQSSKSHKADISSDDEQKDSRRGRSKLERWTSHKERDFSMTTKSSSSLKFKEIDTYANCSLGIKPEEMSRTLDTIDNQHHKEKDAGDPEPMNVDVKAMEDKHLDTVAKLKKRSERFKIPLPNEKEAITNKKMETEPLPSAQRETHMDSEIKPERPARKRRWTSN